MTTMDDDFTVKLPLVNAPGQYALVDGDYDGEWLSGFSWRLAPGGYAWASTTGRRQSYLNRMAYGESLIPPGGLITWRDGNKLDCRTANLVLTTRSEVGSRRIPQPVNSALKNKYGYRGLTILNRNGHRYYVHCAHEYYKENGRMKSFDTREEAARAYDQMAIARWGDRAVLNFPPNAPTHKETPMPTPPARSSKPVTAAERQEIGMHLTALAATLANAFGGDLSMLEADDRDALRRVQKAIEHIMERR